ncbi:MAG: hypothetical protein JNG89_01765 [Planctomycetaceae bacterium]|nr:hypothetical protein [Planctomycetaceae bacterium]
MNNFQKSTAERSWLHTLLRKDPGHLPQWVLSSSGCGIDGVEMISLVGAMLIGLAIMWTFLATIEWPTYAVQLLMGVATLVMSMGPSIALMLLTERARRTERRARAELRRAGEQILPTCDEG